MTQELYREQILELNRHPLNKKLLSGFDVEAREFNPLCGDDITVRIKFDAEGKVQDIGFQGALCAISTAAASVATEETKGKNGAAIAQMNLDDVVRLLGMQIIQTRTPCALLALKAIQAGIKKKETL